MPVKRKRKRKKALLHQTVGRIERLTAQDRTAVDPTTGYSSSELNGYDLLFDIAEDRLGYRPWMDQQETAEALRMRDIRECYAADTHSHHGQYEHLASVCEEAELHIFKLNQHTKYFELKLEWKDSNGKAYKPAIPKPSAAAKKYQPIPIEAGQKGAPVVEIPVKPSSTSPELPKRRRKCKRYIPGDDGECACRTCHEYDLQVAEWFRQKRERENPAA